MYKIHGHTMVSLTEQVEILHCTQNMMKVKTIEKEK